MEGQTIVQGINTYMHNLAEQVPISPQTAPQWMQVVEGLRNITNDLDATVKAVLDQSKSCATCSSFGMGICALTNQPTTSTSSCGDWH